MTRLGWAAAGALATAGLALGSVGLLIARRLTAPVSPRTYGLTIRNVDRSGDRPVVFLDRTSQTIATGDYSLLLESGGLVQLSGEVDDSGPAFVGRTVVHESGQKLEAGMRVSWSGIYFSSPCDAGLEANDVSVSTPEGAAPAWLIPGQDGPSDRWAIHVHGMGSSRAGTLRGVQVASATGLTSLVVSYRNDGEGPVVGTGRSTLGVAELHDVRAAVRFAQASGAQQVVLFGWSMGGAIAMQLASESDSHYKVVGVVLDSPVLDWVSTIKANCARAGFPERLGLLALPWLSSRLSRLAGLQNPIDLRQFDRVACADESTVPVLILHGRGDTSVPFGLSSRLSALRPDLVSFEAFDAADHTMSWNSDHERWRSAVTTWLGGLADV